MKKKIKYEKLSREVKEEIEAFLEKSSKKESSLDIEDAMIKWFNGDFEEWLKRRYAKEGDENKRKHFRIDIEIPVKIVDTLIESSDTDSVEMGIVGTIINISRGGLYFISKEDIEPSSIVMTRIDLSKVDNELKNIEALAMVMHSKKLNDGKYGIGLMFSSIYDDHKENLDLFIFKNIAYHIYSI